jgi:Capsule assembly protein Wzi/PAP2 superfamily
MLLRDRLSYTWVLLLIGVQVLAFGQEPIHSESIPDNPVSNADNSSPRPRARDFAREIFNDQEYIWISPLHLRLQDAEWLTPLAGITTGLMVTDRASSCEITRGNYQHVSNSVSNAGLGALGLAAGSMFLIGAQDGNDQLRETGLLSIEAGMDSAGVAEALKYVFERQRPSDEAGGGQFFQPVGGAFPSDHAAIAFSIAAVTAHEYPGPLTKILAYGAATAISFARVGAQQHSLSDVFVGGTIGYLIGRSVYTRHHDPAVESFGTFGAEGSPLPLGGMSSTYIELDSWVYPAIERLAAFGIIRDEFMGLRPWTRLGVYRMLEGVDADELNASAASLVRSLRTELTQEAGLEAGNQNRAISLDQVYSRTQYLSGTPLNNGFNFGQTLANDFGRPYGRGWQQINGFEARAEQGRFSYFVRGEYQHTPSVPGYSADVAQVIANQDNTPVQPFNGRPAANVFRLLDTYVSMKLLGQDISVGKQSYWWGPGDASAMMLSDNAEPFYSLRIKRTTPLYIPLLSKLLGPFQYDNFFGQLSGHQFPRQPFFYGQKISFSPTENLELGFSRDAVFAGTGPGGTPLTFGNFWQSFTSTTSGSYVLNGHNIPGLRHGGFDFRYRLPGFRNWLTLYADSVVHDDISPVDSPRNAAWTSGVYVAKFPGLAKLDLHVEGGSTDISKRAEGGRFYYYEGVYRDGYTNKGYLLSTWLGREGTGGQAWATYWFSPESTFQLGYRTVKVSHFFVPEGESQGDAYAKLRYAWHNGMAVQGLLQVERWLAPVLATTPQIDITAQIQISFSPTNWGLSKP